MVAMTTNTINAAKVMLRMNLRSMSSMPERFITRLRIFVITPAAMRPMTKMAMALRKTSPYWMP